jgi:LysM repeat protein
VAKLKAINGIKPKGKFSTGQTLLVPVPGTSAVYEPIPVVIPAVATASAPRAPYVVKKGDTLATISGKTGVAVDDLKRWNRAAQGRLAPGIKLALQPPQATVRKASVRKGGKKPVKQTVRPVKSTKQKNS